MRGEAVAAAILATPLLLPSPAAADDGGCWDTAWRCRDLAGIHGPLNQQHVLQDAAKAWSRHMADTGILRHSPAAMNGEYAEIVGYAPDWATVVEAWMDSPPHREILLDSDLRTVGIGVANAGHVNFYTVVFR